MSEKQDNVVSFENMARDRAATLSVRLVGEMRKIVLATVPSLIQSLYEKLDDGLFEQALFEKSARSDALDNLFFDTMRSMRKKRDDFSRKFVQLIVQNFDAFWDYHEVAADTLDSRFQSFSEEDLTLVDASELEEDLALDGVVAKGMREYSKEVYALNQRFAAMKSVDEITDQENPLGPAAISQAFPVSIHGLDVDLRIKLVIYKLFEREVIKYLGAMYDQINDLLKQAGVLPKLPSRVKKNPVSPAVLRQKQLTDPSPAEETGIADSPADVQSQSLSEDELTAMFGQLRDMLHASRGPRSAEHANLPKVEQTELLSALDNLQEAQPQAGEKSLQEVAAEIEQLRERLGGSLGTGGDKARRAYNGMDEDTIDVISMLFEFILEDTNLADAMKALLSRLQIPMLKVAIMDRQFFSNKQHPARRLLNLLAKSAVGWVDDGDRSEQGFYGRVSAVVLKILDDFHDDLGLFVQLYEEFSGFVSKEEQGAGIIEERITEVTRGKEKMKLAQIRVAEVINTRAKAVSNLPEVVRELLRDGWKDALTLAFLRHGEDSEKWIRLVGLVDKLLWSVQPKVEPAERQRLLKAIPELLKALRNELVEISYDQHKLGVMLKQLQACHIRALKGVRTEEVAEEEAAQPAQPVAHKADDAADTGDAHSSQPPPSQRTAASQESTPAGERATADAAPGDRPAASAAKSRSVTRTNLIDSPLLAEKKQSQKPLDEFDQLAAGIMVGAWIEWQSVDDKKLRGKLSWKSTLTETLVFVGRKGTKLAELNQNELAELFRLHKARLLDNHGQPLLDRAMTSMVENLKQNAAQKPA